MATLSPLLFRRVFGAAGCIRDLCARRCSTGIPPRRGCLYVPGNDEKKLRKIPSVNADCVILDCEDGVAANKKEEARHTICRMLDELSFGRTEPIVRINSVDSGLGEEDLDVTLKAKCLPPTIMLPKVEGTHHLDWFAGKLYGEMHERTAQTENVLNLIIFVETAIGLLNLKDSCQRAVELSDSGAPFKLQGVVFGSDDFCADIGATRTSSAAELLYARQNVVVIAKAFGLQAIDLVHIDYHDIDGLREQSLEGARMGFTGKQCIHPAQIPVVQEAFTPSAEKMEWATQLLQEFEIHQASGQGAFTFRGNMIDMPLVLQARNILRLVKAVRPPTTRGGGNENSEEISSGNTKAD